MNVAKLIIKEIFEIIKTDKFRALARLDGEEHKNDWTRTTHKFDLETLIQLSLASTGETLQTGILEYYDYKKFLSKGAYSDAKKKLNNRALIYLLDELVDRLLYRKLPKNLQQRCGKYVPIAVDATEIRLDNCKALREEFGIINSNNKEGKGVSNAQVTVLYDAYNGYIYDVILQRSNGGEQAIAIKMIKRFMEKNPDLNVIFLFDRGYPSVELMYILNSLNVKYIIRKKTRYWKVECENAKSPDEMLYISMEQNRLQNVQDEEIKAVLRQDKFFKVRYSWFVTSRDQDEELLSNLSFDEFSSDDIYGLYGKRWSVEGGYKKLKRIVLPDYVGGRSTHMVHQNLLFAVLVMNFSTLLGRIARYRLREENKSSKTPDEHLIENFVMVVRCVKRYIPDLFGSVLSVRRFGRIWNKIVDSICKCKAIFSPFGRFFPRNSEEWLVMSKLKVHSS